MSPMSCEGPHVSTTIDPGVSHDVPTDTGTDTGMPHEGDGPSRSSRLGLVTRWVGDLSAVVPLLVVLPGLANLDGGRGLAGTWPLALGAAVALPVAWLEVRRLPRVAVTLLATWTTALVLGVVASRYRADMVVPLLQYTIAPVLLLSTRRVWRRPWGPGVLLGLLGLALARYQVRSWLDWWAQTEGGTGFWRPLSWRNPSAALTGMIGVWFLGVGLMSTRLVRVGFALLAVMAFAGTWLSSSRAGLAVAVGAAAIVVALAVRAAGVHGRPVLVPLATAAGVVLATAGLVGGLLSMQPAGSEQALTTREQGVGQNTRARIEHSEAALGMFLDRPLTGQGLGSYGQLARQWNDPEGILTSSAHNEYAEVAGETGVLGITALLGALAGLAWLGLTLLRRPPEPGSLTDLRPGLVVGAAGAAALLLVHSAVDFDWNYPVLSGMAAMAAAVLLPDRVARRAPRWTSAAAASLLAVLLLAGLGLAVLERNEPPAPWQEGPHLVAAAAALEVEQPREALDATAAALRWNPGSPAARSLRALAQYGIDGDAARLQESLAAQPTWFLGRARGAMALAHDGAVEQASEILSHLHDDLDAYRAWGVSTNRLLAVEAGVAVAADRSCETARALVEEWTRNQELADRLPSFAEEVLTERLRSEGCGVR